MWNNIVAAWKLLKRFVQVRVRKFVPSCYQGVLDSRRLDSRRLDVSSFPYDENALSPPSKSDPFSRDFEGNVTGGKNEHAKKQEKKFPTRKPYRTLNQKNHENSLPLENPKPSRRKSTLPPSSPPELICREAPSFQSWEIVLSVNEESLPKEVRFEGGEILNSVSQAEYNIPSLHGRLIVTYQGGKKPDYISLFEESKPLIFRLQKDWQGIGRQVPRITRGYFIVIVPRAWERRGRPPLEPFDCVGMEFRGHYWDTSKSNGENGESDGFIGQDIPSSASIIKLDGPRVFDDSEEEALFVHSVPTLKLPLEVMYAQVGEETKGKWKWNNFRPHEESLSEILGNREGWFFLRVFSDDMKILDTTSFRYLRNLKQICIDSKEYTKDTVLAPTSSGYPLTEICFVYANNVMISLCLPDNSICEAASSSVVKVPARKEADFVSCVLRSPENDEVNIVLNLPRVWWRMESDVVDCDEWRDRPFNMTRQKFQQHASAKAKICLWSSSRRLKSIRVGFDEILDQKYNSLEIPLDNFADYYQITDRLENGSCLRIAWGKEFFSIICISADPSLPPPKPSTPRNSSTSIRVTISARVKRAQCALDEWRNGKGFSRDEIQNAKLTVEKAKSRLIPFDKRRRSLHPINVEKIREII